MNNLHCWGLGFSHGSWMAWMLCLYWLLGTCCSHTEWLIGRSIFSLHYPPTYVLNRRDTTQARWQQVSCYSLWDPFLVLPPSLTMLNHIIQHSVSEVLVSELGCGIYISLIGLIRTALDSQKNWEYSIENFLTLHCHRTVSPIIKIFH